MRVDILKDISAIWWLVIFPIVSFIPNVGMRVIAILVYVGVGLFILWAALTMIIKPK